MERRDFLYQLINDVCSAAFIFCFITGFPMMAIVLVFRYILLCNVIAHSSNYLDLQNPCINSFQ